MGKITRRRKHSELELQQEAKRKRVNAKHNRDKIMWTEEEWNRLSKQGRLEELLVVEPVHKLVHGAAQRWSKKYRDKRLTHADFLSVFYEVTWDTIWEYTWATDYYLYETISLAIQNRGKSLLRDSLDTDLRRAHHEALPLIDGFEHFYPDGESPDVADYVVDKVYEEQFLRDKTLTDSEREVLRVVYDNSQREAARQLNFSRRVVSRTVERIQAKLEPYLTA